MHSVVVMQVLKVCNFLSDTLDLFLVMQNYGNLAKCGKSGIFSNRILNNPIKQKLYSIMF